MHYLLWVLTELDALVAHVSRPHRSTGHLHGITFSVALEIRRSDAGDRTTDRSTDQEAKRFPNSKGPPPCERLFTDLVADSPRSAISVKEGIPALGVEASGANQPDGEVGTPRKRRGKRRERWHPQEFPSLEHWVERAGEI
jgi:hypothetical protein